MNILLPKKTRRRLVEWDFEPTLGGWWAEQRMIEANDGGRTLWGRTFGEYRSHHYMEATLTLAFRVMGLGLRVERDSLAEWSHEHKRRVSVRRAHYSLELGFLFFTITRERELA